jgi:hypothetical protein
MPLPTDLADDILRGSHDHELDDVASAVRQRSRRLAIERGEALLPTLKIGDRIELTSVKPAYMNGATGTIISFKRGGLFEIRLDNPRGRHRDTCLCRPQSLIKLPS